MKSKVLLLVICMLFVGCQNIVRVKDKSGAPIKDVEIISVGLKGSKGPFYTSQRWGKVKIDFTGKPSGIYLSKKGYYSKRIIVNDDTFPLDVTLKSMN